MCGAGGMIFPSAFLFPWSAPRRRTDGTQNIIFCMVSPKSKEVPRASEARMHMDHAFLCARSAPIAPKIPSGDSSVTSVLHGHSRLDIQGHQVFFSQVLFCVKSHFIKPRPPPHTSSVHYSTGTMVKWLILGALFGALHSAPIASAHCTYRDAVSPTSAD